MRGQGVTYSADGGLTFSVSATGLASLDLTSLEVDVRGLTRRIWGTTHGGDGVVYSDDLGTTWKSAAGNGLTDRSVNDLTIQRDSTRRIWATTDSGVFFTDNDGLSWTDLSLGLPSGVPVTSAVVDPNTQEVLVSLFGEEGGVYRGGNTRGLWSPFNSGLGELKVRRLTSDRGHVIDSATVGTTFYAATAGDGVYTSEIQTAAGSPLSILTAGLPDGILRTTYAATLAAEGGTPPYFWSVVEGALPSGLTLDGATGALSGEPGQPGLHALTLQVADAQSRTDRRGFAIEVRNPDVPALRVQDLSLLEGNAGTVNAVFTVTLSPPATGPSVSVGFATGNGTAAAGSDYTATAGLLVFPPGTATRTITVTIAGDTAPEADEAFFVDLSGASGATIARARGTGTILDDDSPPRLSIGDATVTEGDAGTASAVFTVTLSRAIAAGVTVAYSTADETATAPGDYAPRSGTLTFLPGTTSRVITVGVNGDALVETDETFLVELTNPVNAIIADGQGRGTILNDDGIPTLSVADITVTEGAPHAVFTVSLSRAATETVEVSYATTDGTARAPGDYQAASGTLTLAPGDRSRTIAVPLTDDGDDEADEAFVVHLSAAAGAVIGDGEAQALLRDDDVRTISVSEAAVTEGDAGTVSVVFSVSLSAPSVRTVTVDYATVDGTAAAGSDYEPRSGTLTFPPGTVTRTIAVPVRGDALNEADEEFFIDLRNPVHATIGAAEEARTWTPLSPGGAPPPGRYASAAAYDEANDRLITWGGSTDFGVLKDVWVLSGAAGTRGVPTWTQLAPTGDLSAGVYEKAGYDPGTNRLILFGDGPNGHGTFVLTNANGLEFGTPQWLNTSASSLPPGRLATVTAYDPGSNRLLVFGGDRSPFGGGGYSNEVWIQRNANGIGMTSWVRLDVVGFAPEPRAYAAGAYDPVSNRLIVVGGSTPSGLKDDVWVLTDANGLGGTPRWTRLLLTGPRPALRYGHSAVYDGRSNRLILFGGGNGAVAQDDVWVLSNANGLGAPPEWRELVPAGALPPGRTDHLAAYSSSLNRMIVATGFATSTGTRLNDVWVLSRANGLGGRSVATILDNDPQPSLSLADAPTVTEGDVGTRNADFTVSLSGPSGRTVAVAYATQDGSARRGPDYVPTFGVLSIPPGATGTTVRVPVKGDPFPEQVETFFVDIVAQGAVVVRARAQATIVDDDPPANPVPHVSAIVPTAVLPGDPGFELIVRGANLIAASVVRWNGSNRPTVFVSSRELRASIPAADVTTAGTALVTVFNGGPGGGTSNTAPLPVSGPAAVASFARSDVTVGRQPMELGLADLNADGNIDLVLANQLSGTVSVRLGNGDGTFNPGADYDVGPGARAVAAADFNGDGRVDLGVTHDTSPGTVTVMLGNGDGTLGPRSSFESGPNPISLAIGDINGDGALDLVVAHAAGVSAHLGYGDGRILTPGYELVTPGRPTAAALGDFNSDGRLDLAVTIADDQFQNQGVAVFPGHADGTFGAVRQYYAGVNPANHNHLRVADLNGDGHLDLATIGNYSWLLAGVGDGTFGPGLGPFMHGVRSFAISAADLDGDGRLDLAAPLFDVAELLVGLGNGSGDFSNQVTFASGAGPYWADVADLNGDGKLDLAVTNQGADTVSAFLNSPPPTLAVGDAIVTEGDSGSATAVFTVTVSPASVANVSVAYATADGTATAASDYSASSGTVGFLPGETSRTISVSVFGDRDFELDETLFVDLSGPVGAAIGRARGVGTIRNDDTGYALSVSDVTVTEGDAGTVDAVVTVSMPVASPQTVTVDYATADGTAVAGFDYVTTSGTLTFPPGMTAQTVTLRVNGDVSDEVDEAFLLDLSNATNALIVDGQGVATITDDDPEPTLSIDDVTVTEGASVTNALFTVTLSAPSAKEVRVSYSTADGTAHAGTDYLPAPGTLVFAPGMTARNLGVTVSGDTVSEPVETFFVNLSAPINAAIGDGQAQATILDDDALVAAEITSPTPGSTLPGPSVTFTWSPGVGATRYWLSVGTSPGGTQIYNADQGVALSRPVGGIPIDGTTVHVRLWTRLGFEWQLEDYSYSTGHPPRGFYTVAPCRLLDTRNPADGPALAAGAERVFSLLGKCGISASAAAVSINLAVTQPTAGGSLTLFPGGAAPLATAISYSGDQTRGNNGIYRLRSGGEIVVRCNQATGSVHFILDVNGYFVE